MPLGDGSLCAKIKTLYMEFIIPSKLPLAIHVNCTIYATTELCKCFSDSGSGDGGTGAIVGAVVGVILILIFVTAIGILVIFVRCVSCILQCNNHTHFLHFVAE